MNRMYPVFFIAAFACVLAPAFAEQNAHDYTVFLSKEDQSTLFEKGELTGFASRLANLTLWRSVPFAAEVREACPDGPSTIAAEALFLIDRPVSTDAADLDRKILKSFTSFSTMKGLLAYSDSKKKMETFIFDSYRVNSLTDRQAMSDPDIADAPNQSSYTIYQKEEQTGDVYSSMNIGLMGGYDIVTLTNLTELKFLGLRLVAPQELRTVFVVVPLGDKIALYGVTVANTPSFFGLERLKEKSFFYRMKALASWFQGNLLGQ
ncbi:MAG TPA: hypothetical protein PKO22_01900 [Treponemataceae bacterium]|nr:hypothetical protein [Treponemataceae bacterium]